MSTKEEALDKVERNADEGWKQAATRALEIVASKGVPFTADRVWEAMPRGVFTHEPRAMGPIMVKASRSGLIKPTGQYVESCRESCHHRPLREWIVTQDVS